MGEIAYFTLGRRQIAYRLRGGSSPTLVFLPGYASDMEGTKAVAIDALAMRLGRSMLRLDYSGTGSSSGDFEEGTLALWIEEALVAIDRLTTGPLVLVGSSMGAWIALHLALLRKERIQALVGIAAAPDFTRWGMTDEQQRAIVSTGRLEQANSFGPQPQVFTRGFFESAEQLLLLDAEIAIDCHCRFLHGESDREVPLEVAFRLMEALRSSDVQLTVLKGGGHRLSEPHEIQAIVHTLEPLLELKA